MLRYNNSPRSCSIYTSQFFLFTLQGSVCPACVRKREEKYDELFSFYNNEYNKIAQVCGDSGNRCVLLFYHDDGRLGWKACSDTQAALTWLYDVEMHGQLRKFFRLKQFDDVRKVKVNDFRFIDLQLINPRNDEVLLQMRGAYDSCADIASFPHKKKMTKLFHSLSRINGELKPVVYAKLGIDGHVPEKIYEVQMEMGNSWCAIGVPQMRDLNEAKVNQIIDDTRNVFLTRKLGRIL